MSLYQKKHNACMAILPRFQNNWRDEVTAIEAFNKAKASKIHALNEDIARIEALSFSDMKNQGVIVRATTEGCKR